MNEKKSFLEVAGNILVVFFLVVVIAAGMAADLGYEAWRPVANVAVVTAVVLGLGYALYLHIRAWRRRQGA